MAIDGLAVVDDVPGEFADRFIENFQARSKDLYSIALSGGETARRCYERLAEAAGSQVDWWKVDVYWGDERCVPHDHRDSNYRLAREALLDRVGAANATHLMRCAEVDDYQLRVGDLGRFELVHLGLGPDGHTASLFAGSPALDADPGRLVTLNEDPSGRNPYPRMTLTLGGIARARLVLVTVMGEEKAEALRAVWDGDDVPAARIRAERVAWLVDPAAAGKLPGC
ncbi:MAG: 6-phosphogluconolactonase [Actinobacteria bacterium]|nr:6-phosphogluconolactonase [Actinomycetota bacterium]